MVGRMRPLFALFVAVVLIGCGEQAAKEDMIEAPAVSASTAESAKARGLSEAEIARQDAMSKGGQAGNPH